MLVLGWPSKFVLLPVSTSGFETAFITGSSGAFSTGIFSVEAVSVVFSEIWSFSWFLASKAPLTKSSYHFSRITLASSRFLVPEEITFCYLSTKVLPTQFSDLSLPLYMSCLTYMWSLPSFDLCIILINLKFFCVIICGITTYK